MRETLLELDVETLTLDQRLELIGLLWDSIDESAGTFPITDWHYEDLDRRLTPADANPDAGIPWEKVKERLRT